jgi:Na+-translocating ferredoxin:NAD+ oxidoreductase subunit G
MTSTGAPAVKHTGKGDSILTIALNLTGACLISGLIIAAAYFMTHDIAVQKEAELQSLALKSMVKEADTYKDIEGKNGWYIASKDGKTIAYIVPGESKGYGGPIKLLVAVTPDGKVKNFNILSAKETPGLGDKAAKPQFADQLLGKSAENLVVTKSPSEKDKILAISGATITSRAVTLGVKNAVNEVVDFLKEGGK